MSEFGIPETIIRLCRKTLSNTNSSVNIEIYLFESFNTLRGFRQGNPLSCNLFNIVTESGLWTAGGCCNGTILDIGIIGRAKQNFTATFSAIVRESADMGRAVNEDKTKNVCLYYRHVETCSVSDPEFVNGLVYFGFFVASKNVVSLAIKRRVTLVNGCYYGLKNQLSSRELSLATKLVQVTHAFCAFYSSETWTLLILDAAVPEVSTVERPNGGKILKISLPGA